MKNMKKWMTILITVSLICGCFAGCSGSGTQKRILCLAAGTPNDPWSVGSLYQTLEQVNDALDGKWVFTCNAMGIQPNRYTPTIRTLSQEENDLVLLCGNRVYQAGKPLLSGTDRHFAVLDGDRAEPAENVDVLEYNQEQLGFLSAVTAAGQGEKIGYLMGRMDTRGLRRLYGFLQGLQYCGVQEYLLVPCNDTESYDRTMALTTQMLDHGVDVVCTDTEESALGALDAVKDTDAVIIDMGCGLTEKVSAKKRLTSIAVSITLNDSCILEQYLQSDSFGGRKLTFGAAENVFSVTANETCQNTLKSLETAESALEALKNGTAVLKLYADNKDDFSSLRGSMTQSLAISEADRLKYSVEYTYHEATPNVSNELNWKYAPRIGSDGIPDGWTAAGVWGTVYLQDGAEYVENVGIEISNLKLWGYSEETGWVLITHAIPDGSFYDENFAGDSSVAFPGKEHINPDTKTTTVLLDAETVGRNYHPFGTQIELAELGLENIRYVISTMDTRLVVWDEEGPDNRDKARYCFDVGGDWWVSVGAVWNDQWSANRDMAIGQYRVVGTEVTRAYMTTVPSDLFDIIVPQELIEQVTGQN